MRIFLIDRQRTDSEPAGQIQIPLPPFFTPLGLPSLATSPGHQIERLFLHHGRDPRGCRQVILDHIHQGAAHDHPVGKRRHLGHLGAAADPETHGDRQACMDPNA